MFYIDKEHEENSKKIQEVYKKSQFKDFLPASSIYLLSIPEIYHAIKLDLDSERTPFHSLINWDEKNREYQITCNELSKETQSIVKIAFSLQNNHPMTLDYLLIFVTNEKYKKAIIQSLQMHLKITSS